MLLQVLNFVSVLASGLMIWKGLGLITNTESPIVVVLRCVPILIEKGGREGSTRMHDARRGC